ncbi:uncharacterized protein LOC126657420 [Mercurialis annua]|uniref:uncharacterized protein LOC126657420 n=1 Tax=Mercurialis annua TaxID=3986 RepID=UPI00215FF3D0|nr:uncharacterized protein LOC126657420 [Mercurialis annua]
MMGSLEEERLVQMVQDFIESESSSLSAFPPPSSSKCVSTEHDDLYFTLQKIVGQVTEAEAKVVESVEKHMKNKKEGEKISDLKEWLVLKLRIDGFNASICQTSWPASYRCPAGEYEYIEVRWKEEKGSNKRVIVDIEFRSQFEVARPTPFFKHVIKIVPLFFVGSEAKLKKLLSLLCCAAEHSLTETGLYVPPWRTTAYMHSKWLNTNNANRNSQSLTVWIPPQPIRNHHRRGFASASALSHQLSSMRINCC